MRYHGVDGNYYDIDLRLIKLIYLKGSSKIFGKRKSTLLDQAGDLETFLESLDIGNLPNIDAATGQQYATINNVRLPSGSSQKIIEQVFLPNPYITAKFNSSAPSRGTTGDFFDPYEWICSHVYNKCFHTLQLPATTLKFVNSRAPLINYSVHDYNMFNLGSILTCMVVTLDAEIYNFPMIYN